MDTELKKCCDLFIENRKEINKNFKMDAGPISTAVAAFLAGKGKAVDIEAMKSARDALKDKVGVLSNFRGNMKLLLLAKMALEADPDTYLQKVYDVYDHMSGNKFFSGDYLLLSAITIADYAKEKRARDCAAKAYELYEGMNKNHKVLTSSSDYPFAAMLSGTDSDVESLMVDMEESFKILGEFFHAKNAVQALSHVLCFNPEKPAEKCKKVIDIYTKLKDKGYKFDKDLRLPALGALALVDKSVDEIVDSIIEVDKYLKKHKGFGNFNFGKKQRLMYAAQMVVNTYVKDDTNDAVLNVALNLTITMELCAIIMITTMTTSVGGSN